MTPRTRSACGRQIIMNSWQQAPGPTVADLVRRLVLLEDPKGTIALFWPVIPHLLPPQPKATADFSRLRRQSRLLTVKEGVHLGVMVAVPTRQEAQGPAYRPKSTSPSRNMHLPGICA